MSGRNFLRDGLIGIKNVKKNYVQFNRNAGNQLVYTINKVLIRPGPRRCHTVVIPLNTQKHLVYNEYCVHTKRIR